MAKHHQLVDIEVRVHKQTKLAALISVTGVNADAAWVPLAQIELHETQFKGGDLIFTHELTAPETLLIEKGLL